MLRNLAKILWLSTLIVGGGVGIWIYQDHYSTARQVAKLEAQKKQLEDMIGRLSAEKRVADIVVTDQKASEGVLNTELLFVEYTHTGSALPARSFTIKGKWVHIDAMVIKFDRELVKQNDPLRGHSIALFTRMYGDHQSPADAFMIDEPGKIPAIYQSPDSSANSFEQTLWNDFWKLAADENYRKSRGVRVAQGEGVWGPFDPGRLYTITLQADGGLNLTSEPLKGIYLEAMKKKNPV
jgi:hypothetical protein